MSLSDSLLAAQYSADQQLAASTYAADARMYEAELANRARLAELMGSLDGGQTDLAQRWRAELEQRQKLLEMQLGWDKERFAQENELARRAQAWQEAAQRGQISGVLDGNFTEAARAAREQEAMSRAGLYGMSPEGQLTDAARQWRTQAAIGLADTASKMAQTPEDYFRMMNWMQDVGEIEGVPSMIQEAYGVAPSSFFRGRQDTLPVAQTIGNLFQQMGGPPPPAATGAAPAVAAATGMGGTPALPAAAGATPATTAAAEAAAAAIPTGATGTDASSVTPNAETANWAEAAAPPSYAYSQPTPGTPLTGTLPRLPSGGYEQWLNQNKATLDALGVTDYGRGSYDDPDDRRRWYRRELGRIEDYNEGIDDVQPGRGLAVNPTAPTGPGGPGDDEETPPTALSGAPLGQSAFTGAVQANDGNVALRTPGPVAPLDLAGYIQARQEELANWKVAYDDWRKEWFEGDTTYGDRPWSPFGVMMPGAPFDVGGGGMGDGDDDDGDDDGDGDGDGDGDDFAGSFVTRDRDADLGEGFVWRDQSGGDRHIEPGWWTSGPVSWSGPQGKDPNSPPEGDGWIFRSGPGFEDGWYKISGGDAAATGDSAAMGSGMTGEFGAPIPTRPTLTGSEEDEAGDDEELEEDEDRFDGDDDEDRDGGARDEDDPNRGFTEEELMRFWNGGGPGGPGGAPGSVPSKVTPIAAASGDRGPIAGYVAARSARLEGNPQAQVAQEAQRNRETRKRTAYDQIADLVVRRLTKMDPSQQVARPPTIPTGKVPSFAAPAGPGQGMVRPSPMATQKVPQGVAPPVADPRLTGRARALSVASPNARGLRGLPRGRMAPPAPPLPSAGTNWAAIASPPGYGPGGPQDEPDQAFQDILAARTAGLEGGWTPGNQASWQQANLGALQEKFKQGPQSFVGSWWEDRSPTEQGLAVSAMRASRISPEDWLHAYQRTRWANGVDTRRA